MSVNFLMNLNLKSFSFDENVMNAAYDEITNFYDEVTEFMDFYLF